MVASDGIKNFNFWKYVTVYIHTTGHFHARGEHRYKIIALCLRLGYIVSGILYECSVARVRSSF